MFRSIIRRLQIIYRIRYSIVNGYRTANVYRTVSIAGPLHSSYSWRYTREPIIMFTARASRFLIVNLPLNTVELRMRAPHIAQLNSNRIFTKDNNPGIMFNNAKETVINLFNTIPLFGLYLRVHCSGSKKADFCQTSSPRPG
jgi:hypothetical protein